MTPVEILGWLAAGVASLIGVPQLARLVRTRNTDGLSLLAWRSLLAINLAWGSHGIIIGAPNMLVPNALALATTLPVLYLMAKDLGRPLLTVLLPGIVGGAGMIGLDLAFGSAFYGLAAVIPALLANVGQSVELVRAPRVAGVSPMFLGLQLLNQGLWLYWALLIVEPGTQITASVTGLIAGFNVVWWALRSLGLRSLFIPAMALADVPAVEVAEAADPV